MVLFQYPMWVSFGFNYVLPSNASTPSGVSVPYVGELRIQSFTAHLSRKTDKSFSTLCG